jgi:SAM-dependent methyltransferase
MFTASAEYYDLLYSTLKDYASDAEQIAGQLRRLNPACRTVLDAGCGTGEHARLLAAEGFEVDGLDLDPAFVRLAALKHPAGRFVEADMSDFRLPRQYDAVLCLFSSIGYLETLDRVRRAVRCFREHLAPGGVLIVEPWFAPGAMDPDRVVKNTVEAGELQVTRASRVEIDGRVSRLFFDYEITDGAGVRHASEVHVLGLFTHEELLATFRDAGFEVEHDPVGFTDRGLYIATQPTRP